MGIIDRIDVIATEFERITGKHPEYLYVGNEESADIRKLHFEGSSFMYVNNDRLACCGLAVFTVNADKHLRVS